MANTPSKQINTKQSISWHAFAISDICEDKSACAFLKQRFNVCSDPVVSRDICPKSCSLCSTTTTPVPVPCIDTFGNCAYLKQHFNICADANVARQSGCKRTCGLCSHDNKGAFSILKLEGYICQKDKVRKTSLYHDKIILTLHFIFILL